MKLVFGILLALFSMSVHAQPKSERKILVAYFSRSGNTETIARKIESITGGDLFEIQLKKQYPSDYQQLVLQFKDEVANKRWPELKEQVEDMAQYDIIFIGSPNWGSTVAPPVISFLTSNDLRGKTIIPFMTHGGGGWGHSREDIKAVCPQSVFLDGFEISGRQVVGADAEVRNWLREIGIIM